MGRWNVIISETVVTPQNKKQMEYMKQCLNKSDCQAAFTEYSWKIAFNCPISISAIITAAFSISLKLALYSKNL